MDRRRASGPREVCGLALAAALVLGCRDARRDAYWVADRGADALLVLDDELCVLRRLPVPAPSVLAATEHAIWAACAGTRASARPDRLRRLRADGTLEAELAFVGIRDLAASGAEEVLVVDAVSERLGRLWRVDARGRRRLLLELPQASKAATSASGDLVAWEAGELVLTQDDGAVSRWARLTGPILDLAPGPREGTWWALAGPGAADLLLLGPDLEPLWTSATMVGAAHLAPAPGEERVWVADGKNARLYGPGGRVDAERAVLTSGALQAASTTPGGALFFTTGALLELETCGSEARLVRTQGGFSALSALVPAPRQSAH